MKNYILSDGKPISVPLDKEEEFLKQLEEQNLTATLESDGLGKSQGASQPQTNGVNQPQSNQQNITESKSEDGSLESLRLDFESIEKEIKEGDYENKLSNLNNAIEKSTYRQEKNTLINQYNNILKEYQDKVLVQKNTAEKYNKAIDNLKTQTSKTKDDAYFTANEFNLDEIKNINNG